MGLKCQQVDRSTEVLVKEYCIMGASVGAVHIHVPNPRDSHIRALTLDGRRK